MHTKLIEVTNGESANWGKFLIGQFSDMEWVQRSALPMPTAREGEWPPSIISSQGWTERHVLVLDLATGEGALFAPWGLATADLNQKHQIWVCPMFEPFLTWLYAFTRERTGWFEDLPKHIDLPDAPFAMSGHRRQRKT